MPKQQAVSCTLRLALAMAIINARIRECESRTLRREARRES
jgi:hypothetical protein